MNNRPHLYMLVGIPASGKSTWIDKAQFPVGRDTTIVSTDSYIEAMAGILNKTYNDVFQDYIKDATKHMYKDVEWAVEHSTHIVWDQTNINRKARAKKLIVIPDHYKKIAVVFPTPEKEELNRRLNSRFGKTIPQNIIESMISSYEYPMLDEGFDVIMTGDRLETVHSC